MLSALTIILTGDMTAAVIGARTPSPPLMLWAWERPEDLRFVDPQRVGVAFLAGTITLRGPAVHVRPRMQPLQVPTNAIIEAVVRIESDSRFRPDLSQAQRDRIVKSIVRLAEVNRIGRVQIDFDARGSERPFYRDTLQALRHRLPPQTTISITALASWCRGDNWIRDLPVNDAVPMLFRVGGDRAAIWNRLAHNDDFSCHLCRQSLGVSTDEPWPPVRPRRRLYVFNPRPWTPGAVDEVLREVTQ